MRLLTFVLLGLGCLTSQAAFAAPRSKTPEPRDYFLTGSSVAPYSGCRFRFEKLAGVSACFNGDGKYDQTLVQKEMVPVDWLSV